MRILRGLSLLLTLVFFSPSCTRATEATLPQAPVIQRCLSNPPPPPPKITRVDCDQAFCLDNENFRALMLWESELWRWAYHAWKACQLEDK